MKRIRTIQLVIAAAILALPLAAGSDKCTNATLKGNFGSVLTGSVVGVGPFATVATVNLDGAGGWSYTESGSFNGNPIPPQSFTGAYSVKPQCTGSASDSGGNTVVPDRGTSDVPAAPLRLAHDAQRDAAFTASACFTCARL